MLHRFRVCKSLAVVVMLSLTGLFLNPALANTYTVTSTSDFPITGAEISVNNANGVITGGAGNGLVTLRSAIAAANNVAGPHTINLGVGTYSLTIPGTGEGLATPEIDKGDLDVTMNNVTVQGMGHALTIVNQTTGIDRVFDVNVNYVAGVAFNFTIDGVTVSGGRAAPDGGGLFCGSNMAVGLTTVTNCKFLNNQSSGPGLGGGAINNVGGNLMVSNCIFGGNGTTDFNQSGTSGGAIYFDAFATVATFTCSNSTFTNNIALSMSAGGGAIDVAAVNLGTGTVSVSECTFSGNQANSAGGGAIMNESVTLNVTKCTFLNNTANRGGAVRTGGGPGTTVSFSRLVGNTATVEGNGFDGTVLLTGNNNWWGVNTGPGSNDVTGSATATTWLKLTHTPGSNAICPNTSTSLTASFLVNSAGANIAVSDLTVLIGLPIAFNNVQPAGSTVTGAQTTIQANGQATATFNAGSTPGAGGADAVVDNAAIQAAITVLAPPMVTLHPMSLAVCIGDPVSFMSTATGNPVPTRLWQMSTNGGMSFQDILGETGMALAFNGIFADDGNQYRAVYTNICAVVNSNASTLTVYPDEDPDFAYAKTGYCQAGTDPAPTIYGTPGGIFSAPEQLIINTATGQLDLAASTAGGPFTVTYNTNGPCPETATFDVAIVNCIPGATLTDMLVIDNGQIGLADPNDRILLKATISNAQAADYDEMQLNLINDPLVTLVDASFKSTPVAVDDFYLATMNMQLIVTAGNGVLQNDFDDDLLNLTVTNFDAMSAQVGTVMVNADGSFTYNPPMGFTGNDSFNYTVTDSDIQTNSGTVKIKVQ